MMLKVAITYPHFIADEASMIVRALDTAGFDFVHIRKPAFTEVEMERLILNIPEKYRPRLTLHSHFSLCIKYPLIGGVHLNSRWGDEKIPKELTPGIRLSKSMHSLNQLADAERYYYVTLSPVFDSISKPGYQAAFSQADLQEALSDCRANVIALGGVRPDLMPELQRIGFAGGAMLSAAWDIDND